MKSTQVEWAYHQLATKGRVSRNQALRRYITRLGAIVYTLNGMGYKVKGGFVKTKKGKDYVYTLAK